MHIGWTTLNINKAFYNIFSGNKNVHVEESTWYLSSMNFHKIPLPIKLHWTGQIIMDNSTIFAQTNFTVKHSHEPALN